MNLYDVTGHEVIEGQHEALNARDAVLQFMTANPNADVDYVGSRAVMGLCEDSGTPILDGDEYTEDEDGVMVLVKAVDGQGEDEPVFKQAEEEEEEEEEATASSGTAP